MLATYQDLLLEKWLRQRDSEEIFWITENGDKIPIKRLSDYHLDNIINLYKKAFEKEYFEEDAIGGDWRG
jgi:hypothetical protein